MTKRGLDLGNGRARLDHVLPERMLERVRVSQVHRHVRLFAVVAHHPKDLLPREWEKPSGTRILFDPGRDGRLGVEPRILGSEERLFGASRSLEAFEVEEVVGEVCRREAAT